MDPSRMSPELQALVGRAMTDVNFRKALIKDVRGTLKAENINLDEATIQGIERVVADDATSRIGEQFDQVVLQRSAYIT